MYCDCPVQHPEILNDLAMKADSIEPQLEAFRAALPPEYRTAYVAIEDALCSETAKIQRLTAVHFCRQCTECPHK